MTLGQRIQIHQVLPSQALGGTLLQSTPIDTFGFDSFTVLTSFSVAAAGNKVTPKVSDEPAGTYEALSDPERVPVEAGSTLNGNAVVIDCPKYRGGRWLQVDLDRSGANTATGAVWVFLYDADRIPVRQPPTVELFQFEEPGTD